MGTLTVTGAGTYLGPTVISAGTLQIGNGGTTGSLGTLDVIDNSVLAFNHSDAITVDNLISGSGALVQAGSGTTMLTAANTYSGGTTFSGGTIAVSSDANLGAASGALTFNNGTLKYLSTFNLSPTRAIMLQGGGGAVNTIDTNGYSTRFPKSSAGPAAWSRPGPTRLRFPALILLREAWS